MARYLGGMENKHQGTCHCGVVRYTVVVDLARASRCNCTVCTKLATVGGLVKPAAFRLLAGEAALSTYQWGGKIGTRYFCRHCGTHCYVSGHLPKVGGDFVSVNLNTLDDVDPYQLPLVHWDGRHDNWQAGPRATPWPIFVHSGGGHSGRGHSGEHLGAS